MTSRRIGGVLGLVAIGLLAVGVATKAWVAGARGRDTASFGLLGMHYCERGECKEIDCPTKPQRRDRDIHLVGLAGLAAVGATGVLALFGATTAIGAIVRAERPRTVLGVITAVLGVRSILGGIAVVVVSKRVFRAPELQAGYSVVLYCVGGATIAISAILAARRGATS